MPKKAENIKLLSYNLTQTAKALGISIPTAHKWATEGILPAKQVAGRRWLVDIAALEQWLRERNSSEAK